jgi:hypothetical protein
MEGNVLLESYIAHEVPVFHVCSVVAIAILVKECINYVSLETGAAKVSSVTYIIVPYAQCEGARFLPVEVAVLEACVPSVIFVQISGGVLYIFTLDIPSLVAAERNEEVNAQQFIIAFESLALLRINGVLAAFLELYIVNAQFSNIEVIAGSCIESILISNRCIICLLVIVGIKLAKACCYIELAIVVSQFRTWKRKWATFTGPAMPVCVTRINPWTRLTTGMAV